MKGEPSLPSTGSQATVALLCTSSSESPGPDSFAETPTSVGTATPSASVWLCCPLLMGRRTPNPSNCRAERWSWGPRWQLSPPGLVSILGTGVASSNLICHHFPKHLPLSIPWRPPRHPAPTLPTSSVCLVFLCPATTHTHCLCEQGGEQGSGGELTPRQMIVPVQARLEGPTG